MFSVNDSSLIRKNGINYFLSEKKGNVWEVSLIYVKEKNLYLRYIDVTQEEQKAKKNLFLKTSIINKEKVYVATPTKKSFLSFVAEKGFYDIVTYYKKE